MPWFKVDDNLTFHAKVVAAGNPAMGLWVRAGSWCALQLTDGFVPDHMLPALGTKAQAERLVSVRLWSRAEGGYRFHEWAARQPRRVDVEAERAAARDRMREARAKRKGVKQEESPQVSDVRSPELPENFEGTSGEVPDAFALPGPVPVPLPVPTQDKEPSPGKPVALVPADDRFDEWYEIYPRKRGKIAARKAWAKAMKITTADECIAALHRQMAGLLREQPEFRPHPATWLNEGRWDDEDAPAADAPAQGWWNQ
jgi:hypothetical protein